MAGHLCDASDSILLVIDVQPGFLKAIPDQERVVKGAKFLIQVADLLEIPVLASEQYATRMGGSDPELAPCLANHQKPIDKLSFGCTGSREWLAAFDSYEKRQVVIVGAETHICVVQTALGLRELGMEVFLAADAISCRPVGAHEDALSRMRHAGCTVTHTESVVYEWLRSAEHPRFREVLGLVKSFAE